MNTIQEQWESFRKAVIPPTAGPVQVQEMRRAFYAGAEAMWRINMAIGEDSVSEDGGVAILEGVNQEIRQFVEQVQRGEV